MDVVYSSAPMAEMGLAPGGLMRQEVYEDTYGFDSWDTTARSRCFAHILNSAQFLAVSGALPPGKPPTAKDYTEAGLPWFAYYGGDMKALAGAKKLAGLDSVAAKKLKKGAGFLVDNDSPAADDRQGRGRRPGAGGGILGRAHGVTRSLRRRPWIASAQLSAAPVTHRTERGTWPSPNS